MALSKINHVFLFPMRFLHSPCGFENIIIIIIVIVIKRNLTLSIIIVIIIILLWY
jgi:hypothetical protein